MPFNILTPLKPNTVYSPFRMFQERKLGPAMDDRFLYGDKLAMGALKTLYDDLSFYKKMFIDEQQLPKNNFNQHYVFHSHFTRNNVIVEYVEDYHKVNYSWPPIK
jgi:hypothetical protein